jgi:hypothetical protein
MFLMVAQVYKAALLSDHEECGVEGQGLNGSLSLGSGSRPCHRGYHSFHRDFRCVVLMF